MMSRRLRAAQFAVAILPGIIDRSFAIAFANFLWTDGYAPAVAGHSEPRSV
jgi:hypothetical protein